MPSTLPASQEGVGRGKATCRLLFGPARWDRSGVSSWLRGENGNELHGLASDLGLEPWAEGPTRSRLRCLAS